MIVVAGLGTEAENGMQHRDPPPHVPVLGYLERWIEESDFREHRSVHDEAASLERLRRWAEQLGVKVWDDQPFDCRCGGPGGCDDRIRLSRRIVDDHHLTGTPDGMWVASEDRHLRMQLVWQPFVVSVEEGYPLVAGVQN